MQPIKVKNHILLIILYYKTAVLGLNPVSIHFKTGNNEMCSFGGFYATSQEISLYICHFIENINTLRLKVSNYTFRWVSNIKTFCWNTNDTKTCYMAMTWICGICELHFWLCHTLQSFVFNIPVILAALNTKTSYLKVLERLCECRGYFNLSKSDFLSCNLLNNEARKASTTRNKHF